MEKAAVNRLKVSTRMYGATSHDTVILAATATRNSVLENTVKKHGVTSENTPTFLLVAVKN